MSWLFPEDLTVWEFLNSDFFSMIVGLFATAVGALLARNVHSATQEIVENAKSERAQRTLDFMRDQELEAAEAGFVLAGDERFEAAEFESSEDFFEEAQTFIDNLKKKIDDKVAGVKGSRKRRKYQIAKYDYREFVYLLAQDGLIKSDKSQILIGAFTSWYVFRNRESAMPENVFEKIKAAADLSL